MFYFHTLARAVFYIDGEKTKHVVIHPPTDIRLGSEYL